MGESAKGADETAEEIAIEQFFTNHVVPLIAEGDTVSARVFGTGLLCNAHDRKLLVTAGHVLREFLDAQKQATINAGIPARRPKAGETVDINSISGTAHFCKDKSIDLGVFEMDLAKMDYIEESRFLDVGHFATTSVPESESYRVYGFPQLWGSNSAGGRVLRFKVPFSVNLPRFAASIPELATGSTPVDSTKHLLLGWTPEIEQAFKSDAEMQGISGAPIWMPVGGAGVWEPSARLKVVAIQTDVVWKRFVRGTRIEHLHHVLKQLYSP